MPTIANAPNGENTSPANTEKIPISGGKFTQIANLLKNLVASLAQGDLLYYSGSNWARLGAGTTGQFLRTGGASANPSWSSDFAYPPGTLHGLTLSNNGTDPTNDIDIAAGKARDGSDAVNMVLAAALTKRLDAAWVVGSGNGGLDTGSIANATYHIWLIKRSDTGVVDALFSTSATSPTMPTSYDYKRRIGSIVRTGAAIKTFVQDGDIFKWLVPVLDVNATNPGTTAVTRTLTLPTGIRVEAEIAALGVSGTGAADNPGGILITDLSQTDTAASVSVYSTYVYNGGAVANYVGSTLRVFTNTSAQVRSRVEISTANSVLRIVTHGWIDTRGRLA